MDYRSLNLGKYQKCREALKAEGEELDKQVKLLAVLGDCTEDDILNLPLSKYQDKLAEISFLTKTPEVNSKCPNKLKLGANEYYVCKNVEKLTTAQYIDYQTYMQNKDYDMYLANILACFVIPKGHEYCEGYDPLDVIKDINDHMSVETAMSICFFFRQKSLSSIKHTLRSLEWMMRTVRMTNKNKQVKVKVNEALVKMQELQSLLENGDEFAGLTS